MPNPFIDNIPVSTNDLGTILKPIIGARNKGLFKVPDQTTKSQVKAFLRDLYSYDQNPTEEGATKLNNWLTTLELNVVRTKESSDDLLIFHPKKFDTKGNIFEPGKTVRPLKIHAVLVWRMGKVQTAAEPNNPVRNFAWVQEHEGTDGTMLVGIAEALELRGKFGIINSAHARNLANKPGKHITYLSNAAHSDKTIFTPMLEQLREFFPNMPLILTHGMSESATEKLLIGNNYGRMINTGKVPSFGTLLAIALGLQDFGRKEASVKVQSKLPDVKIIRKGKSMPLTGDPLTSALRQNPGGVINTNVSGHAWYGSTNPQYNRGQQSSEFISDKVIHGEFGGSFRRAGSTWLPKYIAAFKQATWWLANYDAEKHNPYKMKTINPAVAADMNLYPTLFPPMPELVTTPAPTPEIPVPTPTPVPKVPAPAPEIPALDEVEEFVTIVEEYVVLITSASTKLKSELVTETIRFMNYLEEKRSSITTPEVLAKVDQILVELSKIREAAVDPEEPKEPDTGDIEIEDGNAPDWEPQPTVPDPDPNYEEDDEELDNNGVVVNPPPVVIPAPVTIKFAPEMKSVTGTIQICCVNLKWLDNPGVDANSAATSNRRLAAIYNNLGGGKFNIQITSKTVAVNFNHASANVYPAAAEAKAIVDKAKKDPKVPYNYYIMYHNNARGYSNATGGIAYCKNTLTRTVLHEIGHLFKPARFHHANRPDQVDAKGKLLVEGEYKDPTSFMGKYSTWCLNGANLYYAGWLPKEKVALFESGTLELGMEPLYNEVKVNDLPVLNVPGKDGYFKAVVLSKAGKDLILSTSVLKDPEPPVVNGKKQAAKNINLFTLYATQNGPEKNEVGPGTTLLKTFKESATFEGWSFQRIAVDGNLAKLRITLTP